MTAILIRARSVVQVHPGPPSKSHTSKYAAILTFPLFGDLPQASRNRFVNGLSTLRLAGWHHTQCVKTLQVKTERLASIRLCRECCPVMSKDVQGSARHCKAVEG